MDIDLHEPEELPPSSNPCFYVSLQVFEGESIDGPRLGKWCNYVAPPPTTSTGNSLTLQLTVKNEFIGHFVAVYSVLNNGTLD